MTPIVFARTKSHNVRNRLHALLLLFFLPAIGYAELSSSRQHELLHLLKHDCGSCHGLTLQGGLGPSLTPERLAGMPREMLLNTITHGRPGTPMPPWISILTEEEISWLVDYLYVGGQE